METRQIRELARALGQCIRRTARHVVPEYPRGLDQSPVQRLTKGASSGHPGLTESGLEALTTQSPAHLVGVMSKAIPAIGSWQAASGGLHDKVMRRHARRRNHVKRGVGHGTRSAVIEG